MIEKRRGEILLPWGLTYTHISPAIKQLAKSVSGVCPSDEGALSLRSKNVHSYILNSDTLAFCHFIFTFRAESERALESIRAPERPELPEKKNENKYTRLTPTNSFHKNGPTCGRALKVEQGAARVSLRAAERSASHALIFSTYALALRSQGWTNDSAPLPAKGQCTSCKHPVHMLQCASLQNRL